MNSAGASGWATGNISVVSAGVSSARVRPNPWKSTSGSDHITFDQMTTNTTVKIFSASSRLVRTLSAPTGDVAWDLTNDSGDKVASGIYLYLITDTDGNKTKGKLAIIR